MYDLGTIGAAVRLDSSGFMQPLSGLQVKAETAMAGVTRVMTAALGSYGAYRLFKEAAVAAMDFGAELSNIKSIAMDMNLDKLGKSLMGIDSGLGYATDMAKAAYFALSSGVKGNEQEIGAFTGTIAQLNKTVVGEMVPTMDAVTTTMNAYNLSVKDAGKVSDWYFNIVKLGKATGQALASSLGNVVGTAAAAGISLEELGAGIATLTTTMPTAQAITSLNQVINNFIAPSKEAKDVAALYGIELSAAALKAKGLAGALAEIKQKTGGSIDIMAKLFTSVEAVKGVLPLVSTQAQMFSDNLKEFGSGSGAMLKALDAQSDNTKTTWTASMSEMNKSMINLGNAISPVIKLTADMIGGAAALVNAVEDNNLKLALGGIAFTAVAVAAGRFVYQLYKIPGTLTAISGALAGETGALAANTVAQNANAIARGRVNAVQHLNYMNALGNLKGPNVMNMGLSQMRGNIGKVAPVAIPFAANGIAAAAGQMGLFSSSVAALGTASAATIAGVTALTAAIAAASFGAGYAISAYTGLGDAIEKYLGLGDAMSAGELENQKKFDKKLDELTERRRESTITRLRQLEKEGKVTANEFKRLMTMLESNNEFKNGKALSEVRGAENNMKDGKPVQNGYDPSLRDKTEKELQWRQKGIEEYQKKYKKTVEDNERTIASLRAYYISNNGKLDYDEQITLNERVLDLKKKTIQDLDSIVMTYRRQAIAAETQEQREQLEKAAQHAEDMRNAETESYRQGVDERKSLYKEWNDFQDRAEAAEKAKKEIQVKIDEMRRGFGMQQEILNADKGGKGNYSQSTIDKSIKMYGDAGKERYEAILNGMQKYSVGVSGEEAKQISFARFLEEQRRSQQKADARNDKAATTQNQQLSELQKLNEQLKRVGGSV